MDEFVIRQHNAKRAGLHHDLHLNGDSWAVPKLVPKSSGQRVLAIKTAYHDPEERRFEGTIAEGYGAGTSTVVDEGDLLILWRKPNHVFFQLLGEAFRGAYHLRHWIGDKWLLWKGKQE